jgi:SnoaL-like domain
MNYDRHILRDMSNLSPTPHAAAARVTAQDRSDAIDLVNRLNFAFDHWQLDELLDSFTENAIFEHPRGRGQGRVEIARFLDAYQPLTIGVRRLALNHIVTAGADGSVTVTYFNVLVRLTTPADAHLLAEAPLLESEAGFPAITTFSRVVDRLRKNEQGEWKIEHKRVDETVVARPRRS